MKYETLHHTAKKIDRLIDNYLQSRGSQFMPQEDLKKLILKDFPDFYVRDFGWHKIVFGIHKIDPIVLKVGAKRSIENDHRVYKRVPESMRHQLFARIFWHTKFCLLQQYGSPAKVTTEELNSLRAMVYKYGIFDIKAENLKRIDGDLKIIDANLTPFPLPTMWKMVDEAKLKFPDRLMLFIKKLTNPIYER